MSLEGLARGGRFAAFPERVDEAVDAQHIRGGRRQGCQEQPLLAAGDYYLLEVVADDVKRAERRSAQLHAIPKGDCPVSDS